MDNKGMIGIDQCDSTIRRTRKPPLANVEPMYMSGLDE
jgi:hypothetical protein